MYILECPAVRRGDIAGTAARATAASPAMRETFVAKAVAGTRVHACQPLTPALSLWQTWTSVSWARTTARRGAVCRTPSSHCQARERCLEGFLQDPEGNCVGERGLPGQACRPGRGWGWSSGRVLGGMGLRA